MLETEQLLHNLNITSNYKGYSLLITAVDIVLENETALDNVVDKIYRRVARRNAISFVSAERNIRTAISHAWSTVPHRFNKVLGYKEDRPPQASAFIKLLYENVKQDRVG